MRSRDGWPGRAAFAVVALYGLLLSTFLGAMAPVRAMPVGIVCAPADPASTPPAAPAHRPDCCTLGCASLPVVLTPPPAHAAPTGSGAAVSPSPARRASLAADLPPYSRLPRGPPAA